MTYPKLGLTATKNTNSSVLHGENVSEVFRIDTDLEKLIPFIGTVLHGDLGPLHYDLLHVKGGPVLSVYQDQTFSPDPKLRLTFSEPVFVGGQATNVAEFPLGSPITWEPMLSNSSQITIVPQYILNNTFHNETGLDVAVQFDVDAVSLTAPFIPPYTSDSTHRIGPLIDPPPTNISLGRIPILNSTWEIPVSSVTGAAITIPKVNIDITPNLGDLGISLATFVQTDPNNPDGVIYNLDFTRAVNGGSPRQYHVQVSGVEAGLDDPGGEGFIHIFKASQDVILTDPVTSEQFNVGRNFCSDADGCDLSAFLPGPGPAFIAADPDNPGQFLPPLYAPAPPIVPNTDVDTANHPILGHPDMTHTNTVSNVQTGTDVVDLRNGPTTTILARSKEFNPERDGDSPRLTFPQSV